MAAGAASLAALLAMPAAADPLADADKRCFNNMAFGDNTLFCMVPPQPGMTVAEYVQHVNYMSREPVTIEAIEAENGLPRGFLTADMPAPETMLAMPASG